MEELNTSLNQYKDQLAIVNQALENVSEDSERESLVTLKSDLNQLIQLTQENLESLGQERKVEQKEDKKELDDEYALFMAEMAKSGAYESDNQQEHSGSKNENQTDNNDEESDIEDELATLLGMKCAVYHTHKWGGQPTLHNAMVSAVVPRQGDDQFKDLQVRVLFTHPTHTEMLPCPFFLEGECRFDDEQCRYSHGAVTHLSNLKEAIEPSFEALKPGSRILMKLKPPDDEDVSVTKKSTEKYHLWHRGVVKSVDLKSNTCAVKLEHGVKSGEKRKAAADEHIVRIEHVFPLNNDEDSDSSSDDSLSDTEYPEIKSIKKDETNRALLVEKSLENNAPAMGEWERHTRGIGSKLMLSMGYIPGTGLGAASDGRVLPVEARVLPTGKSLDQCMAISEKYGQDSLKVTLMVSMGYIPGTGLGAASDGRVLPVEARVLPTGKSLDQCMAISEKYGQDSLKVEQRLKRLQKKEEERNKRAYEREKEKERRNVFNFINKTLGDTEQETTTIPSIDVKQSSSKDLNIEQFKITEDTRKLEREVAKLNTSLARYPPGSGGHTSLAVQIGEKNKELSTLRRREQQISREQKQRKDKEKMTVF